VQPDAEHQEHHADFGELLREADVGLEARGERPDDHAGGEVHDEGRQLEAHRNEAQQQRQPEGAREGGDEGDGVLHHSTR
jgi:hypothetical protein